MKRFTLYALLLCLFLTTFAYANITLDGETVHVDTDRYTVEFKKGVVIHIHNKLTDETYTIGEGPLNWSGMSSYRSGKLEKRVSTLWTPLVSATLIDPFHAELLFQQEDSEVRLYIRIDRGTGDLLIDLEGESDLPGVVGLHWGVGDLDIQNLSIIVPSDGGSIIDVNTPIDSIGHDYPSSSWEAQLAVIQGDRGGFYVRNTDNTFQFKKFSYDRLDDGVSLNFETHNQAPFDSHTTGQSRMWRFNTYVGDWRVPARIYREWMERAFQPRRLSDMPAWVRDITLYVKTSGPHMDLIDFEEMVDRLAELVDPTKTLLYFGAWMDGGDWWDPERSDTSPDYFPKPNLGGCVEAAHRHGFRVLLYVAVHLCSLDYPLYPHLRQYQYRDPWTGELRGQCLDRSCVKPLFPVAHISPASSEWRNLLIGKLKPVWEEYDIDGFHLDASHAVINDGNGLIDGLNLAQGMVLLHKELTEAMPGTIFSGERLHEATFAYESFAQRPLMRGLTPHLISTFLFSPFVHAIGHSPIVPDHDPMLHREMVRYNEFVGAIPVLLIWGAWHLGDEYVEVHKVLELARGWQHEYGLNADVNGDGQVDILDLTLVGQNVGVPFALPQADVDGDGLVNVLDMILVSNMFEGITTAR
jgi:hypothetical protein